MIKKLFISTGEPSGDLHAANFTRAFREISPQTEFVGFGGPRLEAEGVRLLYPLVELAVMWFGRVLANLPTFMRLLDEAERYFRDEKPDAVVVIDYPGFHWALAKRAKRQGIPVFYFVPPQIWAWAGWRVEKVRKYFEAVLCSLPFETEWYAERGIDRATYIGHPYFDELAERRLDAGFLDEQAGPARPLVLLLPGSRRQEIHKNLPMMLSAAEKLARVAPRVRFAAACLNETHQALVLEILEQSAPGLDLDVHADRTGELIRLADIAWAVSGSVGLELLNEALPSLVVYKIKPFDLWVARKFIKSKYISIVNLLADDEVFPEYLTGVDVSAEMAQWAQGLLADRDKRDAVAGRLVDLRDRFAIPGACARAAAAVYEALESHGREAPATAPRPHALEARLTALRPRAKDSAEAHGD